jgi:branched-chain amino acid transport system substrate-binding protein
LNIRQPVRADQPNHRGRNARPNLREDTMSRRINRRKFIAGAAAASGASAFPMPSIAQAAPMKVGLLTVKTGPLAAGGIHAEEGLTAFLKDKNFTLSGRKIELVVADTGGNPAGAKNKAQELVERDKVNIVCGPFAAFELLATLDYLAQAKMPTLAFAGAEDVTQRKGNAYLTRTSYTSAQCLYPLAEYVAKEMKLKTATSIADDFAFGYEQIGGFQRTLEEDGGRVVKKLWSPLSTADYAPYIAQISDCDVVCVGLAGSNPIKFVKQAKGLGIKQKLVGGSTAADDTIIGAYGEEVEGLINTNPYSLDVASDANKRFLVAMRKNYGNDVRIGHYAACFYLDGQVIEAALAKTGGKSDDPDAFVKAIRSVTLAETPRGPVSFDSHGNVVCDVYVRRAEKQGGKMVNKTIKTYHKVSQFWTMDPKKFLEQPVYSRDYPPMKG